MHLPEGEETLSSRQREGVRAARSSIACAAGAVPISAVVSVVAATVVVDLVVILVRRIRPHMDDLPEAN